MNIHTHLFQNIFDIDLGTTSKNDVARDLYDLPLETLITHSNTSTEQFTSKFGNKGNHDKKVGNYNEIILDNSSLICSCCHFLRGSIAGTVAKTIVYPFDRVKMIYQVKGSTLGMKFRISGVLNDMKTIIKNEGISKLWKGNLSTFIRTVPHSGIVYWSHDFYYNIFSSYFESQSAFLRLLSGGLAGLTSTCITYPLDVWNTRMAVSTKATNYSQVMLLSQDGIASSYRGIVPTLIGIFPYAAISFFVFDTTKFYMKNVLGLKFTAIHSLILGGFSGILGQTASYPVDTIRKNMQANRFLFYMQEDGCTSYDRLNMKLTAINIYSKSGMKGFYNGLSLNWIKGFCAAGLSFMTNEILKNFLESQAFCLRL